MESQMNKLRTKYVEGTCTGKPNNAEGKVFDVRRDFTTNPPTVWVKQRTGWVKATPGTSE